MNSSLASIPTKWFYAVALLLAAATTGCFESDDIAQSKLDEPEKAVPAKKIADSKATVDEKQVNNPDVESTKSKEFAEGEMAESESSEHAESIDANEESQFTDENELPSLADVKDNPIQDDEPVEGDVPPEVQTIDIPETWNRIGKKTEIWVDFQNKEVIAAGHICLSAGPLEVFACPRRTKEHEAVVSVNCLSSELHSLLLAIGAEPGSPVKWHEEYQAATGPVVNITVMWDSDDGIQRVRAQEMVTNIKTDRTMEADWVFGGSQTFVDQESGDTYYYGDSGEMVCLSNFSTATLDVPVQSSDANEGLLFEANPKKIPDVNTKVYLIFKPEITPQSAPADSKSAADKDDDENN